MEKTAATFLRDCDAKMDHYAARGVFSGLDRRRAGTNGSNPSVTYRFKWHLDRSFELVANGGTRKLTFPCILPGVEKSHAIDTDLRSFVKSRIGPGVEQHRRLASKPESVRVINRQGSIALSIAAEDDDACTLVERTIGLGHQIFTLFLRNGGYDDYLMDVLGLDLDRYM